MLQFMNSYLYVESYVMGKMEVIGELVGGEEVMRERAEVAETIGGRGATMEGAVEDRGVDVITGWWTPWWTKKGNVGKKAT